MRKQFPNYTLKIIFIAIDLPTPPADLQNIIDKTAAYVLKNGKEFEDILRTKNDPRFSFLCASDINYRYYIYKVTGVVISAAAAAIEAAKMSMSGGEPTLPQKKSLKLTESLPKVALPPPELKIISMSFSTII